MALKRCGRISVLDCGALGEVPVEAVRVRVEAGSDDEGGVIAGPHRVLTPG